LKHIPLPLVSFAFGISPPISYLMHRSLRTTPLVKTLIKCLGTFRVLSIACIMWSLIWLVIVSSGDSLYSPTLKTLCNILPLPSTKATITHNTTHRIVVSSNDILKFLPAISFLMSANSSSYHERGKSVASISIDEQSIFKSSSTQGYLYDRQVISQ
jgi:hypothetical protein